MKALKFGLFTALALFPLGTVVSPCQAGSDAMAEETLMAYALCASAVSTILQGKPGSSSLLGEEGCFIWQQPGAALTVTGIWEAGRESEIWFSGDRLLGMLEHLPGAAIGVPVLHPPEPEDGEYQCNPAVFILDAEMSRGRLAEYMEGYVMWIGYNPGVEFVVPDDSSLETDIALVYVESGGTLEMHFKMGGSGKMLLKHIFLWDYFSA